MKIMGLISLFLSFNIFSVNSQAQMGLEGFSTGRYEVKKTSKQRTPSADVAIETTKVQVTGVVIEKKTEESKSSPVAEVPTPAPITAPPKEKTADIPAPKEPTQEPTISEQAESLFSSKAEKIYEFYRVQVHPDDVRNNRVELDIAPVMTYIDSKSNYSYRNYQSYFNAFKVKAGIWFTPRIGISGQMMMSLAADVDGVNTNSRIPAKYEYLDLGLNFRKFFGVSRLSNSVEFSILFSDNKANFESNNTSRSRLRTNGMGLGIKSRIPTSENYAWVLGGNFFPRIQHAESQAGINLSSGSHSESTRLGVDAGGELKFDRESQVIWNLGLSTERNIFDDTAAALDPSTGSAPSNVSVTNSTVMFSLGYRWGH